ncbi:MAG: hypothetical protein ACYC1U_06785 [Candidatus Aquicultorales bacterium]
MASQNAIDVDVTIAIRRPGKRTKKEVFGLTGKTGGEARAIAGVREAIQERLTALERAAVRERIEDDLRGGYVLSAKGPRGAAHTVQVIEFWPLLFEVRRGGRIHAQVNDLGALLSALEEIAPLEKWRTVR